MYGKDGVAGVRSDGPQCEECCPREVVTHCETAVVIHFFDVVAHTDTIQSLYSSGIWSVCVCASGVSFTHSPDYLFKIHGLPLPFFSTLHHSHLHVYLSLLLFFFRVHGSARQRFVGTALCHLLACWSPHFFLALSKRKEKKKKILDTAVHVHTSTQRISLT